MKLLFLIGNAAVGKMTVGQELMKRTGLRLFHNHMTIEPVLEIFGYYHKSAIDRLRDVIFEEFKGTGNMELVLDRRLSERRIFPAIDIFKSGTRRDDLLLTKEEQEAVASVRRATSGAKANDAAESVLDLFARTKTNKDFIDMAKKIRF